MKMRLALLLVGTLLAVSSPALAQRNRDLPANIRTNSYTLKLDVVGRGLDNPWAIAWLDRDTIIVTEKPGTLRLIKGGKLSEPIAGTPVIRDVGQGGLLDVSVDPEYAQNGWIYLSYTHPRGDSTEGNAPTMTRVVRGKLSSDRTKWVDQQVLWEAKPEHYRGGGVHFGSRIVFDKQGLLYFSIGERGRQNDAQDVGLPNGKIHRINRDGSIPKDNPFVGRANAYASIWTYGHRNPQGMAFHPETDALYATEHGPRGGDELNLIGRGINYGWPVITYGINYNGTKITDLTEKEGMEQPVRQWTPSIAVCGLDFVTGKLLPKWENQLLVGALAFRELRRVKVEGGTVVDEEVILKDLGRVRDVQVGPDGAIYVVLNGPNVVIRLSPQ
jgi:glucose/arabinose dehydrogenase